MRSDGEEQRVMEILDRLRTEVKHRELLLKTFFDKVCMHVHGRDVCSYYTIDSGGLFHLSFNYSLL